MIRRDDVQFAVTTSLGLVRRIRGRLLRAT
jgi:hypothetical protein